MITPKDNDARARLWIALGNGPGVGAWFSVWALSREAKRHENEPCKTARSGTEHCHNRVKGSPA
jgi:hypothetical protein